MTNIELLRECKLGLGIPVESTTFDGVINPKILAVKGYMTGAGVTDTVLGSDLSVGAIVMGVTDIWNIQPGEAKFSAIFNTFLCQLAMSK